MAQLLVWAKPRSGDFAPGDIVEVLQDGVHAGNAIINDGEAWDGSVRADSDYIIFDFDPGSTERQAIREFVQQATGGVVPDLRTLNRFVRFRWELLPVDGRNNILQHRRRAITMDQFRRYIGLREGITVQDVVVAYNRTVPPEQRIGDGAIR